MEKKYMLHMNGGDGAASYANNSALQKFAMSKTMGVLDETLKGMFADNSFAKEFRIVDLGCSSGPNTVIVISHILDTIKDLCRHGNLPEYEVYLNDLGDNDFNNLFKMLTDFKQGRKSCFVFGLPGSFYERLLPTNTLHFAYSCYSIHWLSQIPEKVEKNNKENFCVAKTSPREVFEAYSNQFQSDFSRFLRCRGEELMSGGHMVLAFVCRRVADHSSDDVCGSLWLLAETLAELVAEGIVNEDDLQSFNMPMYNPCRQEVEAIVDQEGSFNVNKIEAFEVPWDGNGYKDEDGQAADKYRSGKLAADCVRAFMEPMLTHHFSDAVSMDGVFDRYTRKVVQHIDMAMERPSYLTLLVALNRI